MSTEATAPPLDPALYESRAGVPIAVVTVALTVATTAVSLRCYTRAVMLRQFGWDDWAAIVAILLAMGSGIMVATNTIYGHGRHIAVLDPSQLYKYFRTFYISIVLYNGSLTATKLTFLLQYYRILGQGQMRKVITVAFVIVALWSISQLLVTIFNCTPIQKFWLPETPGTCIPNLPFWYINAAGNIVTDVIVFVVPLPALSRLNLRKGQKLALIGVFCLGFFTCAISVIRIQYLSLSTDVTWDNVASSCWSIGELCSGITCACLPTLRPLVSKCLPSMRSQSGKSSGKYYQKSSGRDGSTGSDAKVGDNNSSRGIVYPEDLELQSDDRSDKEVSVARIEEARANASHQKPSRTMEKLTLGLNPTVKTEIKVGSPGAQPSWTAIDRRIEVKTDLVMTKELP
ncbi:Rhodopsin domain-containing protein [Madurella fahalii]|uniref:Rhodopsin domain-containing protein n=1 Tax=Madurella fahalii TaxID=1157608 RepID=A0ABQ0FYK3_9PEZI